eukprot:SAG11_NODE_11283_length_771_cov_1.031250_1_plen_95_part_00
MTHAATLVVGAVVTIADAYATDELVKELGGTVGEITAVMEDGTRHARFAALTEEALHPEQLALATADQVVKMSEGRPHMYGRSSRCLKPMGIGG